MPDPARNPGPATAPRRDAFDPGEVAAVLARYPIGPVRSVRPFFRGSSRAPKALVAADSGEFLLKRRAPGRDNPFRVAFDHGLQVHLARTGFPVAPLVPAAPDNNSMVRADGHVYELFRFIHGRRTDGSAAETAEAGAMLARFHALAANYSAPWPPPPGTYHNSPPIVRTLRGIPARLGPHAREVVEKLVTAYARAAGAVESLRFTSWPPQVLHGDWHPGNLLYEDGRIIAVLDFDAARIAPRAIDIANGALQFSMSYRETAPASWPPGLDLAGLRAFLGAYDASEGAVISRTELSALPWLMVQALIAEAAPPIAATGRFARLDGYEFLLMVDRQTDWIRLRSEEIAGLLG